MVSARWNQPYAFPALKCLHMDEVSDRSIWPNPMLMPTNPWDEQDRHSQTTINFFRAL